MGLKKLGFELLPGTGWETAWAAAPAALAGFQAASAQRQLGKVRTDIDNYRRQDIENPFANLSNPYENLAVATQAAEIKMEQTDQALANTLDTLRETGAAAGGATAIANAALKSKQGIAASIEKQEVDNQKLQAKGQLQVDIAKGKGETVRMQMQENRDINELNRLQAQADMAQYRRDMSIQTGLSALGDAAAVRNAGIVPQQRDEKLQIQSGLSKDAGITSGTSSSIMPTINNQTGAQVTGLDPSQSQLNTITQDQQEINKLANASATSNPLQNITIDPNLPTNTVMEDLNLGQQVNLNPVGQQAQPNQNQLNYTGSFSDISDDVKIRDGKMQAPPGWNEQEAQNRINSWYSMKKENNLANK